MLYFASSALYPALAPCAGRAAADSDLRARLITILRRGLCFARAALISPTLLRPRYILRYVGSAPGAPPIHFACALASRQVRLASGADALGAERDAFGQVVGVEIVLVILFGFDGRSDDGLGFALFAERILERGEDGARHGDHQSAAAASGHYLWCFSNLLLQSYGLYS